MDLRKKCPVFVFILALVVGSFAAAQPAGQSSDSDLKARIDALLAGVYKPGEP
jgi:hypothetical protein